jgi:peptidoglycan L-alanyl-D-glutamate endopeptidase CwlK
MNWSICPPPVEFAEQSRFDGVRWRVSAQGVHVDGAAAVERTPGEPQTCRRICELFAAQIIERSIEFAIPPELIVMTIATEAAAYRSSGYTGPATFRWEAHVEVKDAPPPYRGDYSVGPMQTLATTARALIRRNALNYDALAVFPAYRFRPAAPPEAIDGYTPAINIHIGCAEIASRLANTGLNPILVAAAYNSGGVYDASKSTKYRNRWNLRSHGNHLDRAAKWYGDACSVLAQLRG